MIERFAILYFRDGLISIEEVLSDAQGFGLRLENPASHDVSVLSPEGDRVRSSAVEIRRLYEQEGQVTFLMWAEVSSQVYVTLRNIDEKYCANEYIVDYADEFVLTRIRDTALSLYRAHITLGASVAFVFDPDGETLIADWDAFVVSGCKEMPAAQPRVLGIPSECADRLRGPLQSEVERIGTHVLLTKTTSIRTSHS